MGNKVGTSWEELRAKLLQDPETYSAYKELEPEYEIVSEIIKKSKK